MPKRKKKGGGKAGMSIEDRLVGSIEEALSDAVVGARERLRDVVRAALQESRLSWVTALIDAADAKASPPRAKPANGRRGGKRRPRAPHQMVSVAERIQRVLKANPKGLISRDVVRKVGASYQGVYFVLNQLVDKGIVAREGKRPRTIWRLAD